jgi:hypothetical protein
MLFLIWYLCITTKHELQLLCNEVPRRVKYIDNLGHYIAKNFVVYTVYLVKHHYFICPQSLVAYIIHHTHSLACSHAVYRRDSEFPATHLPPVCIFLYDEYICYEKWHHKLKMTVPLYATSILQNNLPMHEKILGSRFHFRPKKKKTTALDRGEGSASPPSCFIPKETDPWVFAE